MASANDRPILVTGGAGFIGSNFVLECVNGRKIPVVTLDKLTYAGNLRNLQSVLDNPGHMFVHGDINDRAIVADLLRRYSPRAVVHFAAESHVDRSIHGPEEFITSNVLGTFSLLHESLQYWRSMDAEQKRDFRFLHVSTDEVYGSLLPEEPAFTERTAYAPNSPYSASKAGSDHLVRAYAHTYGLPTLITNCSNNYGPFQFPEKLIPLIIHNALRGKPIPVYGDGQNVRDWLYVTDHCDGILTVLEKGEVGERYNIGGENELKNLDVVRTICGILDELAPNSPVMPHESLITFVADRPGHDRRYAMDITKIRRELNWTPRETFASGIRKTVVWYLEHQEWVEEVVSGEYQNWVHTNYGKRTLA